MTKREVALTEAHREQVEYSELCAKARRLGIDTSLDTNPGLDTVAKLEDAVREAEAERCTCLSVDDFASGVGFTDSRGCPVHGGEEEA